MEKHRQYKFTVESTLACPNRLLRHGRPLEAGHHRKSQKQDLKQKAVSLISQRSRWILTNQKDGGYCVRLTLKPS